MAEDITPQEEDDIFASLGIEFEDEHEDEVEAAEAKADEEDDKITRKLSKKVDDLEHKFEKNALKQAVESFAEKADPLEKDLFREVMADIKSVEDFDRTVKLVQERAAKLKEREEQLMKEAEERAEATAARAWGTAPSSATPEPSDEDKKRMERIATGDSAAAFAALWDGGPGL
jgi:hypothetical protein